MEYSPRQIGRLQPARRETPRRAMPTRRFQYDGLNRLVQAEGRTHADTSGGYLAMSPKGVPYSNSTTAWAPTRTRAALGQGLSAVWRSEAGGLRRLGR